jgi:transposase
VEYRATVRALRATAERALAAHAEATQLGRQLGTLARVVAPALLAQPGVGPVTAAQVLISWSHPRRLRSKAAFARKSRPLSSRIVVGLIRPDRALRKWYPATDLSS